MTHWRRYASAPPLFKAVVSVAGHALRVGLDARPTPVFMVHGDGDAVVPLDGCCGGNEALPICAAATTLPVRHCPHLPFPILEACCRVLMCHVRR